MKLKLACLFLACFWVISCQKKDSATTLVTPVEETLNAQIKSDNPALISTSNHTFQVEVLSKMPNQGITAEITLTREDNGRQVAKITQNVAQASSSFTLTDFPLNQTFAVAQVKLTSKSNANNVWTGNFKIKTSVASPVSEADPAQYGTPMSNVPTTDKMVMYEVNIKALSNTANLQGVINRLDEIKALGVNVIWLMPIHPVGILKTVGSPYCVRDYKGVNPDFGTLANMRTLVGEAHSRGMAVIIDWVANHTAWDNPWIQYKSWYSQDALGNIIIPAGTNWQDVADLDFDNPDMRLAMIKALKYWVLDANVDGFRCDAADFVPFSFWKQAIDSLKKIPNRNLLLLAEGARADHFNAGFQMNYGWDFYGAIKNVFQNNQNATNIFTTHTNEYNAIPAGSQKLRFTTNHDESAWDATPMTIFGGKQGALCASVITSFLGGVPLLYSSQEVGRQATLSFFNNVPIDWTANADMLATYKSLFTLYNASNALRKGTLTTYPDNHVVCFKRVFGTEEMLIIANVRNANSTLTLPTALANTNWTNALTNNAQALGTSIALSPYQYLILQK
ncbi:MAG: alpha-amylase [Bacteroidetes bacterium]|nr:MAG: alpha-amylase [Bacteroidota bacterium]